MLRSSTAVPVATEQQKAEWQARLEQIGETHVRADIQQRSGVGIGFSGEMVEVAVDWLREKEREREYRDSIIYDSATQTLAYAKWTLIAAIAAVVVGIIGIIVTTVMGR